MDQSNRVKLSFEPTTMVEQFGEKWLKADYESLIKLLAAQKALSDIKCTLDPASHASIDKVQNSITEKIETLINNLAGTNNQVKNLVTTTLSFIRDATKRPVWHKGGAVFHVSHISQVELFVINNRLRIAGYGVLLVCTNWSSS